ncbi:DUF3310 domain-containing protein [Deltaproteobacteria bacterium]|nr:DUF3310 domain-containing protein [Deltaproteobacteria bacterium]
MSINNATPQDWDRLRKQAPAIEDSLMVRYLDEAEKELEEEEDMVGAPKHYNTGNIECIDAIEESMSSVAFKGYLKGNCMKYLWRYDYKGKQVEDLQKAQWYLAKLLNVVVFENEDDDYNEEEHLGCLNFPFCDTEGCGGG